jgi:hypothetical protein
MAASGSGKSGAARALAVGLLWVCLVAVIVLVARRGDVRPGDAPNVAGVALYVGLLMLVLGLAWRHRGSRVLAGLLGLLALGLAVVGVEVGVLFFSVIWQPTFRGHLEVWNRTQAPITIVGRELTFAVPACGHAAQDDFVLNRWDIHDDRDRFVRGLGGSGYAMVTGDGAVFLSSPPPEPLPPCEGVIEGQSTNPPSSVAP